MSVNDDFKIYESFYTSFKDEALNFLLEIKEQHKATVDIYNIDGRIKTATSAEEKLKNSDEFNCSSLFFLILIFFVVNLKSSAIVNKVII